MPKARRSGAGDGTAGTHESAKNFSFARSRCAAGGVAAARSRRRSSPTSPAGSGRTEHRTRARRGGATGPAPKLAERHSRICRASGRAAARSATSRRGCRRARTIPLNAGGQEAHGRRGSRKTIRRRTACRPACRASRRIRGASLQTPTTHDLHPVRRQHPQLPADLHGRPQASRRSRIRRGTATRSATRKATRWSSTPSGSTTSSGSISAATRTPRSCTRIERYTRTDIGTLVNETTIDDPARTTRSRSRSTFTARAAAGRRADGIHLPGKRAGRRSTSRGRREHPRSNLKFKVQSWEVTESAEVVQAFRPAVTKECA